MSVGQRRWYLKKVYLIHPVTILALGYLLLILGYGPTRGLYQHAGQVALVVAGWLALLLPFVRARRRTQENRAWHVPLLLAVVTMSFVLFVSADGPIFLASTSKMSTLAVIRWCAVLVWCAYVLEAAVRMYGNPIFQWCQAYGWYRWLLKCRFSLLIGIAFILRILVIWYVPSPAIDVFFMMKDGPHALLSGADPYNAEYPNPFGLEGPMFTTDIYGYLPGMLLISMPMQILFEDPRIGYLVAAAFTGYILYLIARHGSRAYALSAELVVLAFLYIPHSLFVTEQAWNEPYLVALLTFITYCILRQWRVAAYAVAGFFLSAKQTVAPYLLTFVMHAWNTRYMRYGALLMGVVCAAVVVPFVLWSKEGLLNDAIIHHTTYGAIPHALSVSTLYWQTTGIEMPKSVTIFYSAVFILFMWWRVRTNDFVHLLHAATLYLLGVFILQRGFANYYYFISVALIILMALSLSRSARSSAINNEPS